jgi:hypothetical protein
VVGSVVCTAEESRDYFHLGAANDIWKRKQYQPYMNMVGQWGREWVRNWHG